MERKLLSLPSFFVLLLVAGIAFLAAPVGDVHAALTGSNTIAVVRTTPATGNATSGNAVFTITFATHAVKVTGETPQGGSEIAVGDGFGPEDLEVKHVQSSTSPQGDGSTKIYGASGYTFAKTDSQPTAGVQTVAGSGVVFTVTIPVPSGHNGNLSVTVKTAAAGASFEEVVTPAMEYAGGTAVTATIPYVAYNPKPTVQVNWTDGAATDRTPTSNAGPFEVTFAIADTADFSQVPTFVAANIAVVGGSINSVGPVTQGANKQAYSANAYITPNTGVDHVVVGVKADAVTDAGGAKNEAVPTTLDDDGAVDDEKALKVTVDTVVPTVKMTPALTRNTENVVTSIVATFEIQEKSGTPAADATILLAALEGGDGDDLDYGTSASDQDITVTGGTLSNFQFKPTQYYAIYTATITPAATAEEVVITVKADAVSDSAGNGNVKTSWTIETDYEPDTPPPVSTETGIGAALDGKDGFSFTIDVPARSFVVLAKSPANTGFTSAVGSFAYEGASASTTRLDIKDDIWVDLRHFLIGREGGSIDLKKSGDTGAKVRSLVISEVMWGNDDGLRPTSDSQWIELYNTTGAAIDGTWILEFSNKSRGLEMDANDANTSAAKPVVDKLSTWKKVGNVWEWRIEDTAGGSHGQSGKSTLNSATSPGSPVELISMQRKIDYAKVEKLDHNKDDAVKNREEQLKGIPDGAASGGWEASKEHGDLLAYRKGTPGKKPVIRTFDKTGVPRGSVVFNEIANRSEAKHDWIELYNKSGSDKKINGWELSLVTAKGTDTEWFTFTSDNDIIVPAKGYLLVVNTKPRNTTLEGGYNVTDPGSSERDGAAAVRPYYVSDKVNIPDTSFLLILRNGNDKTGTHEKIEDIAGKNPRFEDADINTEVWPLRAWTVGATDDLGQNDTKTWVRDQGKAVFHGDEWKPDGGFTGVGIKRKHTASNSYTSGTPGYANNAVQNEVKSDGLTETTPVVISEIMFAAHGRAPQWIELHNPSPTQAVNLNKWVLEVFNYRGDATLNVNDYAELVLPERRIQPNQTVLIVSRETSRMSGSDEFPDDRIIGIWNETDLRKAFDMQSQNDAILSSMGFHLKLSDPKKKMVDEVGNIDANRRNNDEPAWALPDGASDQGSRSSMVRVEDTENDGEESDSWRDADFVDSAKINTDANELYYGDPDDVGTPGYTPGGVLPVQLSSFYSKRNDAGAVVITWSTESELDNAGFNILRSLSRVGEFTRINAQLIPGAGTTGEKNTYTWTDTSARPNVVYYYQIEDVSLDGEHRTLRTTRLRGYVGAAGKATTIWGELKSRD